MKIRGVFARGRHTDNSRDGWLQQRNISSFLIGAEANVKSVEGYGALGKGNTLDRSTYYEPSYIIMSSLFRHQGGWDRKIVALKKGLELGMNLIDTAEKYQTEDVAIL